MPPPLSLPQQPQQRGCVAGGGHVTVPSVTSRLIQLIQQQPARQRHLPAPHPRSRQLQQRSVAVRLAPDSPAVDVLSQLSRVLLPPMVSAAAYRTAYRKWAEQLARRAAVDEVCRVFGVEGGREELQDLLAALVLSECVYKKVEMPPEQLAATVAAYLADFPPELVHLEALQLSRPDITQNYLVAVGGRCLYVAFMGTKQARDISTDLAFAHEAVWGAGGGPEQQQQQAQQARAEVPSAHRGFLSRAKAVPIDELQALAVASGRRLVLCGHSLGGGVAKLVGLRLLRSAPSWAPPDLRVICFATPAVGNDALARLVGAAGWGGFFKTYVLPEDQLMRVLRLTQAEAGAAAPAGEAAAAAAAADGAAGASVAAAAGGGGGGGGAGQALAAPSPVATLVNLLQQPMERESAAQQLRRELQAEEATTPPLDTTTASMDVAGDRPGASLEPPSLLPARQPSPRLPPSSRLPQLLRSISRRVAPAAAQRGTAAGPPATGLAAVLEHDAAVAAADDGPLLQPAGSPNSSSSGSSIAARAQSMAVVLELQRRWVGYQLQQLGRAAASPVTRARQAATLFAPFGLYRFITAEGVLPPESPPPGTSEPPSRQAAAFAGANPGVINFHRMAAYRARCVYVVARVSEGLLARGLLLPPSFGAVARFAATFALDVAGAPPAAATAAAAPDAAAAAAGSAGAAGVAVAAGDKAGAAARAKPVPRPIRLGGVIPALKVSAVEARPPLRSPPVLLPAPDAALAGGAGSTTAASGPLPPPPPPQQQQQQEPGQLQTAAAGRPGPLSFWQAGRGGSSEAAVPLTIRLVGANLHLVHSLRVTVGAQAFRAVRLGGGEGSSSSAEASGGQLLASVPDSGAAMMTPGPSSSSPDGRSSSSSMFTSVRDRLQQVAVAASKAWEGDRPRWRTPEDAQTSLALQVLLPVSVVQQLTAAALAEAPSTTSWRQPAPRGPAGAGTAAGSSSSYRRVRSSPALLPPSGQASATQASIQQPRQQQQQRLLLHLKSDWQELSVPVALRPHVVGVVGSSSRAALLLQALLSQSGALQQEFAAHALAAAATAPAGGGKGLGSSPSSLQRWLPQPGKWRAPRRPEEQQQAVAATRAAARLSTLSGQLDPRPGTSVRNGTSSSSNSSSRPASSRGVGVEGAQGLGRRGSSGTSPRAPGLPGVVYATLPPPKPLLPALLSRAGSPIARGARQQQQQQLGGGSSAPKTMSQVLKRATRQLQRQAAFGSALDLGLGAAPGVAAWVAAAGDRVKQALLLGDGSGPLSPPHARSSQQQQQGGGVAWDVLLLCVSYDSDGIALLKHRSALARLAAAASVAGVQLVPVLLVEGDEAALSTSLSELRAIGLPNYSSSSSSAHSHELLRVEAMAAQLASALELPSSVPVFRVPVQGLLARGVGGGNDGALLREVGGLEDQHRLLAALQRLEGHLAGLMQAVAATAGQRVQPQLVPLLKARL